MKSILIANRGEIAIRIMDAVAGLGLSPVALYSADDKDALHLKLAARAHGLAARGPAAYLDMKALIGAAIDMGCDGIHPGYGFLSESAEFARRVIAAGLTFIGPDPATLECLGQKTSALELARSLDIPVITGLGAGADLAEIARFMGQHAPVLLKAVGGGGGRGMRLVTNSDDLADVLATVTAEAAAAFGNPAIYVERYLPHARHIEVQVIGDGTTAAHLWERDCTLQRRHQKVVEIAPAQNLAADLRDQLLRAACLMATKVGLRGLATFEFLLDGQGRFVFIESNPRLQVEHTITEAITGVDLVQTQIRLAAGEPLAKLNLTQAQIARPRGVAMELRINSERLQGDGSVLPTSGRLTGYTPPGGPGVRVDGCGFAGMRPNPAFDSLLAKLIVTAPDMVQLLARARRALAQFQIDGVETNKPVLAALLKMAETGNSTATTTLIDDNAPALCAAQPALGNAAPETKDRVLAPMQGTVLSFAVKPGDIVAKGARLLVMEAMKMQHTIRAPGHARVLGFALSAGDMVRAGDLLVTLEPLKGGAAASPKTTGPDPDYIRPELDELFKRRALTQDAARPEAVQKRRRHKKRMARENVAGLCDEGSFIEYGELVIAAQRSRRGLDDLMKNTPADGLITGFGRINSALFGRDAAHCAVMAYDYTVLAGTQGMMNHAKKDRMLDLIARQKTPLVFFCEGGGGRPGDVDAMETTIGGLDLTTFWHHARLSGLVPMVGIGSGRVFAGNAALLGCSDVVIATKDATIGMGGPAMIEGGGLGIFTPDEVGPTSVQAANGVIDILVADEAAAALAARKYLGYFQGRVKTWQAPDGRALRHVVPENRLEVYDVHAAIEGIFDHGSALELRAGFARGMVTALARIAGRPVGVLANNPLYLSGAIDADGADKAARFIGLCDAFDIPIVSLCDTPGIMVGPEAEKTALVRHVARLFLAAGNVSVPYMTVVLRKGYGLGAMAMAGGSFRASLFTVAWPTGEFGGMGLEGAVRLGYKKELAAVAGPKARKALFEQMVAQSYARGKAINTASVLEIDTVIDPAETRRWIVGALEAAPEPAPRTGKKCGFVDAW